jgi:hypothetical protein
MRSFAPHVEILPESQRTLWPSLGPAAGLGFVLYDGTAVAIASPQLALPAGPERH